MRQCPKCYSPNNDTSQYCESCGTALVQGETRRPTMAYQETQQASPQYPIPPIQYPVPEPGYIPTPEPPVYAQTYDPLLGSQEGQLIYPWQIARKKSGPAFFFGILLYLIGASLAAFGMAGILVPTGNNTLVGSVFLIVCLLEILALILILIFYHRSLLRGWLRIVLFFVLTILAAIALVAVFATSPGEHATTPTEYAGLGIICIIYGLLMEVIAFL